MSDQPKTDAPGGSNSPGGGDAPAPAADMTKPPAKGPISRGRRWLVNGIIVLATVLSLFTILSVWANRLLFNPDNWAKTSTQLLQNPDIRNATANFIVDRIYARVDVAGQLATALPPRLKPLAGPAAGALRSGAVKATDAALQRPRIQALWTAANRRADQLLVTIVNGGKGAVGVAGGVVTLDLTQVVDTVAARLGLPSSITSRLPSNIGTLTLFKSDKVSLVEDVGNAIRHLALLFSILLPLLWASAIGLARGRRRRTLMSVGFSMVVAGVLGVAVRHILQTGVVNSIVQNDAQRPAVRATIAIGTQIFAEIAIAFLLVGIVVIVAAWFAGPARIAVAGRRAIAPFLRERPGLTYAIVLSVMLLLFLWQPIHALGTPVGIVVFLCLALLGTELLRRQTAAEFPDAQRGDASAAIRGRIAARRDRAQSGGAAAPEPSLPEQLEQLVVLRDGGAISASEYDEAKARLLHA
ncbi:MAG TPA: SHOCT domain-containing protein [Solirubrobacteraceae bacterium]